MRYRLIQLIALLCMSVSAFAQENGSFEGYFGTNPSEAFNDGTVPNWRQSHGTPTIFSGAPGQGAFAAWMYSYDGEGEGIVQNFSFEFGEQYEIKFWVKTNNPNGTIFIKAANGVPYGVTSRIDHEVPSVSSQQTIFNDGMNYDTWQEVTVEFTPNNDYEHLWIYPFLGAGVGTIQAELLIDGIQITKRSCHTISANQVTNNSFENLTGTQLDNAFALGQVVDWKQSHGKPEIRSTASHLGNYSAWMSASTRFSSGILKDVVFRQGQQYRIKLWIKGSTQQNAAFVIKLAKGVPSSPFPLFPLGNISSQTVYSKQPTFDDWTEVSITFTPDTYYNQLWFHPVVYENTNLEVGIDKVVVEEVSCSYLYIRATKQKVLIEDGQNSLGASVYPNPATKAIKITLPLATKQVNVSLIEVSNGKRVASFVVNRSQNEWVIPANIKNGTYLVVMTDPSNNTTKTTRLVVNRK
ncbi:MAG TPA: hypothetical protein DCS93_11605 [Microscillaceae bacterium]|nr:hypothetical protein [Microscillaceae bacterium]